VNQVNNSPVNKALVDQHPVDRYNQPANQLALLLAKKVFMKYAIAIISLFLLTAFKFADHKTTVYLVGDSTISIKETNAYPETGWGMPFAYFFDSSVRVDNRAMNGRSTRTFIEEKRWESVMKTLTEGDYVFIQFGHNDEVPTKRSYTKPEDFIANLEGFVNDVRGKNAFPVLLTPVARRSFDSTGHITDTHAEYSAFVKQVAEKMKVPFIDLNTKSQALLQKFGVENSRLLFLQLQPGEHPNYPKGKEDNTHFNELGARLMAEIVLQEIKELKLPLADKIYKGKR
jgi:lysophospholipase L1-like esterase